MAGVAKLSITLPAKQAANIRKAVKSGAFASDSEAISEAVRVWEDQLQYLRQAWKEGLESGTVPGEWNVEDFIRMARERKARNAQPKVRRTAKRR